MRQNIITYNFNKEIYEGGEKKEIKNRRKRGRSRDETKERTCIGEEMKDRRKDGMKTRKKEINVGINRKQMNGAKDRRKEEGIKI
jgi:hypothetical protein